MRASRHPASQPSLTGSEMWGGIAFCLGRRRCGRFHATSGGSVCRRSDDLARPPTWCCRLPERFVGANRRHRRNGRAPAYDHRCVGGSELGSRGDGCSCHRPHPAERLRLRDRPLPALRAHQRCNRRALSAQARNDCQGAADPHCRGLIACTSARWPLGRRRQRCSHT